MPKALVLGGYGLIGSACMRALASDGFEVVGLGRSHRRAMASNSSATWVIRDIPSVTAQEWRDLLEGVDVVVNASGALQDGGPDDLEAIHVTAITHLAQAATGLPVRIIQISAAGVSAEASTQFFRSKAWGDSILSSTAANWVILRPTLVLSPEAYGGTALLRAAAALPLIQPHIMPKAMIQTVHVEDVAAAVLACSRGEIPSGTIADLTEPETRSFPELLEAVRHWQGWPPPVLRLSIPGPFLKALGKGADFLGHLGWRSPLRSTALQALSDGIKGDPSCWAEAGGQPCRPLRQTLASLPATHQERLFARAYVALPLAVATLALFWCLSGIIALLDPSSAMTILSERGAPPWLAPLVVFGGAVADLALGCAILHRSFTRRAAFGMLVLSALYLIGSLIFALDLWSDPLGPMVKVLPGMALAAFTWLLLEDL